MYLEEMAVELEDQDWLDMSNVEQVPFLIVCPQQTAAMLLDPVHSPDTTWLVSTSSYCVWYSSLATHPNPPIL